MKSYIYAIACFFLVLGTAVGLENYMDYGEDNYDRNLENLREFYINLLRHNSYDNSMKTRLALDSPYEHLMIRKSQRSPSLRLRFGRSDPSMPQANLMTRSASSVTSIEDN